MFEKMFSATDEQMKEMLTAAKTIAVLGHSDKPYRTSYQIAHYLRMVGYRVIPVNPTVSEIDGNKCYPNLASIEEKIDIVNVFRRSEYLHDIMQNTFDLGLKNIWTQLGVVDEFAGIFAKKNKVRLVMDRCIMVEHRRLI